MSKYDVYGIGNALVDMEYSLTPEDLQRLGIEKGVMTLVDVDHQSEMMVYLDEHHVHRSAGGSAANTVIALAQFGGRGFYTCKVADDDLGRLYADDLKENGVETNAHEVVEPGYTGRCMVLVTPDADRTMCTYLGITGSLGKAELVPEAIRESEYLYLEGYLATSETAREAVAEARGIAREAGVRTAISLSDPNIVSHFGVQLREMIGDGVDLLFANEDEAKELTGTKRIEDAIDALGSSAREFVVTRGPKGAIVFDGEREFSVDARRVDAIDTVGAGDMFAGAFLYGLTQGWGHERAARFAVSASADIITTYGPRLTRDRALGVRDAMAGAA